MSAPTSVTANQPTVTGEGFGFSSTSSDDVGMIVYFDVYS